VFKILFIGDIVGRSGRRVLLDNIRALQQQHVIDYTIVNAENAAGGFGITQSIAASILENGADPYQNVPGDEYAMYHARVTNNARMIALLRKYEK